MGSSWEIHSLFSHIVESGYKRKLCYTYCMPYPLLFLLFALIVLIQWRRIFLLNKENQAISQVALLKPHKPHVYTDSSHFQHAPFASCHVDQNGTILWANIPFLQLTSAAKVANLTEFDQKTGGNLAKNNGTHHTISLRSTNPDDLHQRRTFSVLRWPIVSGSNQKGEIITLHEETVNVQNRLYNAAFEAQIVQYLAGLASQLQHFSTKDGHIDPSLLEAISSEANSLATYLGELHEVTRRQNPHSSVDLSRLATLTIDQLKSEFVKRKIQVIKTFPFHAPARGNEVDFLIGLRILFDAIRDSVPNGTALRIHMHTTEKQVLLRCTIPDMVLPAEDIRHPFNFGHNIKNMPTPLRLWRLQLAMCHQLFLKYHASLHISSENHEGTVYQITFATSAK